MNFDSGLGLTVADIDIHVHRSACERDGTTLDEAWDALVAAGYDPASMTRTDDAIHVLHVQRPVVFFDKEHPNG